MMKDIDMFAGLGGKVKLWLVSPQGEKTFIGEFHNCITKAAKDAILGTFAQSAISKKLDSSFYAQRIAFCSDIPPATPYNMALVSVESYETLDSANPDIAPTVSGATVTLTATYTNPGGVGAIVRITYLAAVMDDADPTAGNVLSVILLESPYSPVNVAGGASLIAEYEVGYKYQN